MSETSARALGILEAAQLFASLLPDQLEKNIGKDEIRKTKTHHLQTSRDPDTSRRFFRKNYTRNIQIHKPFLQDDIQSFSGYQEMNSEQNIRRQGYRVLTEVQAFHYAIR